MMLVCKDCGQLFDKPQEWEEHHGLSSPPYEKFSGCPFCSGTYAEAKQCDGCGEYIIGKYIRTVDNTFYCEDCFSEFDTDSD